MKFQGKLPLVLSLLMMTILSVLAYNRIVSLDGVHATVSKAIVCLYAVWIVLEGKIAAKEVGKEKTNLDKGTMEIYAVSRCLTVVFALAAKPMWTSPTLIGLGLLVFVGGVSFRLIAIRTLGRFYSHRVRITAEHAIVTTGPYRFVRHPAYTGMFVAHLGFVLFFFNWFGLAALLGLLLPSIIVRIKIEEKELMSVEGYSEYSSGVKRLIPVIW